VKRLETESEYDQVFIHTFVLLTLGPLRLEPIMESKELETTVNFYFLERISCKFKLVCNSCSQRSESLIILSSMFNIMRSVQWDLVELIQLRSRSICRKYAEMVEKRLRNMGFRVDMMFLKPETKLTAVLAGLTTMRTMFGVTIHPQHEINRSLTIHVIETPPGAPIQRKHECKKPVQYHLKHSSV